MRLLTLGTLLLCALACQREAGSKRDKRSSASPSASQLDGMQLTSARRVALESAIAAMQRHDLERLKMLSVWVRNRAQVAIFEPDDLTSLDLAIECLERGSPPPGALQRLEQLPSGTLKQPAHDVCIGRTRE